MSVTIKSPEEIDKMRIAGRLAGEVLDYIAPFVVPGISTEKLDKLCHDYMVDVQGCIPAPLNYAPPGYTPYPKSICTSVNHVVCHGIPGERPLKSGDIVNLDITTIKDGFHGDTSRMFIVGEASIMAKRLCSIAFECLWLGISRVKPGACLGDIGSIIQRHAEKKRVFSGARILRSWHRPQFP
jgi:methionyl aminopeptidase